MEAGKIFVGSADEALEVALQRAGFLSVVSVLCVFQDGQNAYTIKTVKAEPSGKRWLLQSVGNRSGLSRAGVSKVLKEAVAAPGAGIQPVIFLHHRWSHDSPYSWSLRDRKLSPMLVDGKLIRVEYKLPDQKRP